MFLVKTIMTLKIAKKQFSIYFYRTFAKKENDYNLKLNACQTLAKDKQAKREAKPLIVMKNNEDSRKKDREKYNNNIR